MWLEATVNWSRPPTQDMVAVWISIGVKSIIIWEIMQQHMLVDANSMSDTDLMIMQVLQSCSQHLQ